jgi:hypothetical protein
MDNATTEDPEIATPEKPLTVAMLVSADLATSVSCQTDRRSGAPYLQIGALQLEPPDDRAAALAWWRGLLDASSDGLVKEEALQVPSAHSPGKLVEAPAVTPLECLEAMQDISASQSEYRRAMAETSRVGYPVRPEREDGMEPQEGLVNSEYYCEVTGTNGEFTVRDISAYTAREAKEKLTPEGHAVESVKVWPDGLSRSAGRDPIVSWSRDTEEVPA